MLGEIKRVVIPREEGDLVLQPGEESKGGRRGEGLPRGAGVGGEGGQVWGEGTWRPGSGARPGEEGRGPGRGGKRLSATLTPHHGRPPLPAAAAITGRRRAAMATGPGGRGGCRGPTPLARAVAARVQSGLVLCFGVSLRQSHQKHLCACPRSKRDLYDPEVRFLLLWLLLTPFFGWAITYEMPLPQVYILSLSFV